MPNVSAFANEQISDRLGRKEPLDFLAFLKLTVTTFFRRGERWKKTRRTWLPDWHGRVFLSEAVLGKGVEPLDNLLES